MTRDQFWQDYCTISHTSSNMSNVAFQFHKTKHDSDCVENTHQHTWEFLWMLGRLRVATNSVPAGISKATPKFWLGLHQSWGEYQMYEYKYKYEYLQYVWVRVRVLDYCMSTSMSTGWWVRVRVLAYDLHSI